MLSANHHRLPRLDWLRRFLGDRRGQDLIEYALLLMMASLALVATVPVVSGEVTTVLSRVGRVLASASTQGSNTVVVSDTDQQQTDNNREHD